MTDNETNKKINKLRLRISIGYVLIAIALLFIYFYYLKKHIFYFKVKEDVWNFYRFLWCIPFACLGFAFLGFKYVKETGSPIPKYILYYPILLLVICSAVFGVLHLFNSSSSFVYYYLSAPICFTLGFSADRFFDLAIYFLKNKK